MINLINYIPESFLTVCILCFIVVVTLYPRVFMNDTQSHVLNNLASWLTLAALVGTFILLFFYEDTTIMHMPCAFAITGSAIILKKIIVFFSILGLAPITQAFNLQKLNRFEFFPLYLISVLSSVLLLSVIDFLTLYLVIEMQGLCFYIMSTLRSDSIYSVKAGLKYYIFGSVTSCILLFSLSVLFASLGSLNFITITQLLIFYPYNGVEGMESFKIIIVICLFFISITLLFKLGIVPFHFWVADVYEGSPLCTTIVLSFLPKLALFDFLVRLSLVFHSAFSEITFFIFLTGLLSIGVGSFLALSQYRLKRFLIYSSIAQMGFPILLLSTGYVGACSLYFFMIVYTISSILTWIVYTILYKYIRKTEPSLREVPLLLSDLTNLVKSDSRFSILLTIILLFSAGVPPLPIFLTKFSAIFEILKNDSVITAIVALFLTVVPTYYYVRLIKIIYFDKVEYKMKRLSFEGKYDGLLIINFIVALFCFIALLHSFIFFDTWMLFAHFIYSKIGW